MISFSDPVVSERMQALRVLQRGAFRAGRLFVVRTTVLPAPARRSGRRTEPMAHAVVPQPRPRDARTVHPRTIPRALLGIGLP